MNEEWLDPEKIQYLPTHRCPQCGAQGIPNDNQMEWVTAYRNFSQQFGTLNNPWNHWCTYTGYVLFDCQCAHDYGRQMFVVHLGDAFLPVPQLNAHLDAIALSLYDVDRGERTVIQENIRRVALALDCLARCAIPSKLEGCDELMRLLFAISAGNEPPDLAYAKITGWLGGGESYITSIEKAAVAVPHT